MAAVISLDIEPAAIQIQAGGRASARVKLVNRGDTVGQYLLSVSGLDPTWFKLDTPQAGVFPGDHSAVQLSIRLPADAAAATYHVVIQAQNQTVAADQGRAGLDLTVSRGRDAGEPARTAGPQADAGASAQATVLSPRAQPAAAVPAVQSAFGETVLKAISTSGQVKLAVDRGGLNLIPGASQSLNIAATNEGGVGVTLELGAKGAPLSWFSIVPARLALPPGGTEYATLKAAIPAQTPIGSYPLVLSAQGGDDPGLAVRITMMLEVSRPGAVTLEINPGQLQGETGGEYKVGLAQNGLEPLNVNLTARDPAGLLDFTFSPAVITLPAQGRAECRLTVRTRQALVGAETQAIGFDINAALPGGATASARGQFTQLRGQPVKLLLEPDEVRDAAGGVFGVRIVNPGAAGVMYRMSAADSAGICTCQFDQETLSVPARGEAGTALRVTPQQFLAAGETVHTVRVSAQPAAGGELLETLVRFVQEAGKPPELKLLPASQTSAGAATYQIQIGNPRPDPLQIEIRAFDTGQQLQFRIEPPGLVVAPLRQAAVRLEVIPTRALLPAETRRPCAFTVAGYAANQAAPITVEGTLLLVQGFTWRKLLPIFIAAFLLLGAGAVGVIILLWMRFMR